MEMFDGSVLEVLAKNGYQNLLKREKVINNMNVFPVPDGDTGTNMRLTIENGIKTAESCENLGEYASSLAMGMLLGARGNSGVIFSQIFKGISGSLKGKKEAGADDLAEALVEGYRCAYAAVVHPTEGTMLTVCREGIEKILGEIDTETSYQHLFELYVGQMGSTLEKTPEMLPMLKEAGVVDSGGMGLLCFFKGFAEMLEEGNEELSPAAVKPAFTAENDGEFGYCTEFILKLDKNHEDFDIKKYISYLETEGESIVAVRDDSLVKVHVHTEKPMKVLGSALKYGEFISVKVEDMDAMHEALEETGESHTIHGERKKTAFVAVAQGDGLIETFNSLGCDVVINGGQTMNTSTEEFLTVFSQLNADNIVVLPNNSNLEMAAQQAGELLGNKKLRIIHSSNFAEGYFAMAMVEGNNDETDEIEKMMSEAMSGISTVSVSRANRDTEFSGVRCREGDYIGMSGKTLVCSGSDIIDVIVRSIATIENLEDMETVLLIRGQNISEETGLEAEDKIAERFSWLTVGTIDGGQDVYDYVIGIT